MNNASPFIEVFEPQVMPNGEYAASAHVHLGPEGHVRIIATAPRAVAAKAMAHAQAFVSRHLGQGGAAAAVPSRTPPPPPFMPPSTPMPLGVEPPPMPPLLRIPPGIRPPSAGHSGAGPLIASSMAQARQLIHQAAAVQPLAVETARTARRFVPMLLRSVGRARATDLAQLFERAAMLLEAAERDPDARARLTEAVRRARRDGQLLQVLQTVRAAERQSGMAGVEAIKRLAGASSLIGRADGGDGAALEQLHRVTRAAMAPDGGEPVAARAAGYLSVADTELVQATTPAGFEVGGHAMSVAAEADEPALLELVRALAGMRAGYRRAAR